MSQGTPQSGVSLADHRTWADRVKEEETDRLRHDLDKEMDGTWSGPDLVEVSEETQNPDCCLHAKREQRNEKTFSRALPATEGSCNKVTQPTCRPLSEDRGSSKRKSK